MRRALRVMALLLVVGLSLPLAPPPALGATGSASVLLTGITQSGHARPGDFFSASGIRALVIQVDWRTLVGTHAQRLELIAPDGAIYQHLTTEIESVTGSAVSETRIPVSGTWITEYGLHGQWRVHVYLDEVQTPAATVHFTLDK